MTPDPAATERAARVEMDRLTRLISQQAVIRRKALHDLHRQLGTWQRVADHTGQKLAAVHKAVRRPRKKDQ